VEVAARIAEGDLQARIRENSQDEIGSRRRRHRQNRRRVEQSFAAVQSSQRQLETLLNSMQDAVIRRQLRRLGAVANQPMNRPGATGQLAYSSPSSKPFATSDFLAAVKEATTSREVTTARATPSFPAALLT